MLYDPKDYFRILMEIDMPAIINPFGEASFYMSQRFIKNVVLPQLQYRYSQPDPDLHSVLRPPLQRLQMVSSQQKYQIPEQASAKD